MLRVGLTGSIGAGKSSVARALGERGALVLDADAIAREATDDPEVLRRITEALGPGLVAGGKLDRPALAARVFADAGSRSVLNAIVHPWVGRRRAELVAEAEAREDPPRVVVEDVPLLFEVGLDRQMDVTVAVVAPLELRVARLLTRSGLTRQEVMAREVAQMPQDDKAARADHVIVNDGTVEELGCKVDRLWAELTKEGDAA